MIFSVIYVNFSHLTSPHLFHCLGDQTEHFTIYLSTLQVVSFSFWCLFRKILTETCQFFTSYSFTMFYGMVLANSDDHEKFTYHLSLNSCTVCQEVVTGQRVNCIIVKCYEAKLLYEDVRTYSQNL